MADEQNSATPWKNGYWHSRKMPALLYLVDGDNILMHTASGKPTFVHKSPMAKVSWKYGDYGEAHPGIAKETGKTHCNMMIVGMGGIWKSAAVLSEDGKSITCYGMTKSVDVLEWMSEEKHSRFIASGDPADALPCPYKIQPENQGDLIWISGAPGLGKSTTAMMMAERSGKVYYEADCFMSHQNPYVPVGAGDPSVAMYGQKFLKNVPQDRVDIVALGKGPFLAMVEGKEFDAKVLMTYYKFVCKDIAREHARIGGDFIIAQAVPKQSIRDFIRRELGSNLIFVVLHMSKEDQGARLRARHGDQKTLTDKLENMYKLYEPAGVDEPNTINCVVTKDMSRDDVFNHVQSLVESYKKEHKK